MRLCEVTDFMGPLRGLRRFELYGPAIGERLGDVNRGPDVVTPAWFVQWMSPLPVNGICTVDGEKLWYNAIGQIDGLARFYAVVRMKPEDVAFEEERHAEYEQTVSKKCNLTRDPITARIVSQFDYRGDGTADAAFMFQADPRWRRPVDVADAEVLGWFVWPLERFIGY